jgi:hypothetical protein
VSFAPFGQYVAHRPSVPLLVRPGLPSTASAQPSTRASASNVKRASLEPPPAVRVPPPVPGSRHQAAPHHRPLAAFTTSRARPPDERPPPRRRVRQRSIPTQARTSATGGFEHRPTSLAGLGRTGLSGSSLPVPLGPGSAIFPARPLERLGRTGHPLARPVALDSYHRQLSRALAPAYPGPESRLASRYNQMAGDFKRRPLAARGRFQRACPVACRGRRGGPAAATARQPTASRTCLG